MHPGFSQHSCWWPSTVYYWVICRHSEAIIGRFYRFPKRICKPGQIRLYCRSACSKCTLSKKSIFNYIYSLFAVAEWQFADSNFPLAAWSPQRCVKPYKQWNHCRVDVICITKWQAPGMPRANLTTSPPQCVFLTSNCNLTYIGVFRVAGQAYGLTQYVLYISFKQQ